MYVCAAAVPHGGGLWRQPRRLPRTRSERVFLIDNLLVRIHFIIEMIWWTGLAPWEFGLPFPGILTSLHRQVFALSQSAALQRFTRQYDSRGHILALAFLMFKVKVKHFLALA